MINTEESRAQAANQVLSSPIYKEAYRIIEERLVNELASAELADDRAAKIRNLLVGLRKVRTYMEQVVMSGKLSALEEAQKASAKSWLERVRTFNN